MIADGSARMTTLHPRGTCEVERIPVWETSTIPGDAELNVRFAPKHARYQPDMRPVAGDFDNGFPKIRCSNPSGGVKNQPDEITVEEHLFGQQRFVTHDPGQDDAAIADGRKHIGKVIEIDLDPWLVTGGDFLDAFAESFAPTQDRLGIDIAHLLIKELFMITDRSHDTPGMTVWKILENLGQKFERNQKAVQRILAQFVGLSENLVKNQAVLIDVAFKQGARQVRLVPKVIEEAAL
ncbi:hypothetical protein [Roseovarius sp. CAU 1744]|uniref:hypothetical protein n=1 Tax=Roseovarius sp. CAU 1744 TaxID=3140368 RepID=UPI00325AA751